MPSSRTLRKLCQARDLIRDFLDDDLTLAEVSQDAGLSTWHFLRESKVAPHFALFL
jgi:AraC-like DNA-binding protein